jgi:hypothetical protein
VARWETREWSNSRTLRLVSSGSTVSRVGVLPVGRRGLRAAAGAQQPVGLPHDDVSRVRGSAGACAAARWAHAAVGHRCCQNASPYVVAGRLTQALCHGVGVWRSPSGRLQARTEPGDTGGRRNTKRGERACTRCAARYLSYPAGHTWTSGR